ncbi:MAG: hypothetical protein WAN10_13240 [Candidatus Acidiferrales bacterium]
MNPLSHFVFELILKKPGIEGRQVRARLKGKISARHVNKTLFWLLDAKKVRAEKQPQIGKGKPSSRYYPKEAA